MRTDKVTSKFQQPLSDAQSLAVGRDHQFIEPAHLMLALLNQKGGTVRPLQVQAGADVKQLRSGIGEAVDRLSRVEGNGGEVHLSNDLGKIFYITDKLARRRQALEKYTIDLTERAEQGKLDPVIGRDEEIRRTIQVLQHRTKNNPVLIGEPGVGKIFGEMKEI